MTRSVAQARPARSAPDLETRASPEDHASLRVWLRLLSCANLIEARIRQSMHAQFDTTLPRFDLMAQLERVPEGLKMGELSRRMMVTGGNVTGITDALEEEGLVARVADRSDRRALRVRLTAEGRRQFACMAADHERWIEQLFAGLGRRDQQELCRLLARLKQHVAGQAPRED